MTGIFAHRDASEHLHVDEEIALSFEEGGDNPTFIARQAMWCVPVT